MRWNGCHLTYCLNIHPGETFQSVIEAIHGPVKRVKKRISPDASFGLGLRLSAEAARELENQTDVFREDLVAMGMYVFTINGFPYGRFHGTPVKKDVYAPDWTQPERVDYTKRLVGILSELVPEGVTGSISTVPIGYGGDIAELAIENLLETGEYCERVRSRTGREVILALEPEPDCLLSTTDDVLELWTRLREKGTDEQLRHLGVCVDTCHSACEFEPPAESLRRLEETGIRVPKIQISAAPRVPSDQNSAETLRPFDEDVYLHQTRIRQGDSVQRYPDLPAALQEQPMGEWRVHFHVPLHYDGESGPESTVEELTPDFWKQAVKSGRHLEIETYSFDVLPDGDEDVVTSVCNEFRWMMEQSNGSGKKIGS